MEEFVIKAEIRKGSGKIVARKLRKEGFIPAVLYGKSMPSLPISISVNDWEKLRKRLKRNTIINMELPDNGGVKREPVMVKDIQKSVIGDKIKHIDFLHVSMERKMEVEIPINLIGTAKGTINNGIVELHLRTIMVECLPSQIPDKVDIDVTNLDIGDSIHVHEIQIPGVKLLEHPDVAIVTVIPPTGEEKAVTEETLVEEKKEG
ncbi:MAG: 50S ribosomal protein L25 [Syntrophorhabdaceae bacterium]|nr:50S ribosomal protein L25 [Syntrophorhabdaceae bacterium]